MARIFHERQDVIPALTELFRTLGYEGVSISAITEATGLGKGSLYHFFPNGKAEMAEVVLADIDQWFERNIFAPLRDHTDPDRAINQVFDSVVAYFQSGQRVCLLGAFALDATRDKFAAAIRAYFSRWIDALSHTLARKDIPKGEARFVSENVVASIQGSLVLARSMNDSGIFVRNVEHLRNLCLI